MDNYSTILMLEKLRKKIVIYQYLPIILFAFASFLCGFMGKVSYGIIIGGIAIVIALILGCQVPFLKKEFKDLYKNKFVKPTLCRILENVEYDWNMGFTELEVMSFGIVKLGNILESEDYVSATYKGVDFRQADVIVKKETGSGSDKEVQTFFKGRMFEFSFSSKIVANVKIFSKSYISHMNIILSKIEMEDVAFNKSFNVYSSDPVEAFYILTPQMMEKIKEISKQYPNIAFRFAPGKLYIGIATEDSLDANLTKKISYPEEIAKIKKDVKVITDIIEMLDLIRDNIP
ncbi:MAG: DUF3137 domain-containing protein [Wujia sp.]